MNVKRILESNKVSFKTKGGQFWLICPYHNDHGPSLEVNPRSGGYHCWSCGTIGKFSTLLEDLHITSYLVFDDEGEEVKKEVNRRLNPSILNEFVPVSKSTKAVDYLTHKRKIFHYERFVLKYCSINHRLKKWRGRIVMPIYDFDGTFLSISGRTIYNSPIKLFRFPGIKTNTFFGSQLINQFDKLVMVEGEFDAIYLQQFGIPAVATFGTGRFRFSKEQRAYLLKFKEIGITMDNDVAGRKAGMAIVKDLRDYLNVHLILLPPLKDPNDLRESEVNDVYKDYI